MTRKVVSDHATLRFLERHDGYDTRRARLACAGDRRGDAAILDYLADVECVDIPAVRRRILTDTMRTAIGSGASGVRMGPCRFVIVKGVVVTVRRAEWDRSRCVVWRRPPGRTTANAVIAAGLAEINR